MSAKTPGELSGLVRGDVIVEGDADYEDARSVHNGMIDKRPAVVVRVMNTGDVMAAVNYARDNSLELSTRGGGHSGPGFGTNDGGVVIDFSKMRGVRVDPSAKTARAEGGTTWGDFNAATHAFVLATTGGHHFHDRDCRSHARWWDRLPDARIRIGAGQPGVSRRGNRGRPNAGCERA